MGLYVYNDRLFKSQDEAETWIAENELYFGEEHLMSILESGELYELEDFNDLLEYAENNGYTIQELCTEYDIDLKEFLLNE